MNARLGLLAVSALLLFAPPAKAAVSLAGTVTVSGSETGYALVNWPGGEAGLSWLQRGDFAAIAVVPDGAAPTWHNSWGSTEWTNTQCCKAGSRWGETAPPPGLYRLYLLTPTGTTATVKLTFPGSLGSSTVTPDHAVPLQQKIRAGRPSSVAPATLIVGGSETPSSGSIGFNVLRFEADGPATAEVCSYLDGTDFREAPSDAGPFSYEPGCADGLHTAERGRGASGTVRPPWPFEGQGYTTQIDGWFAPTREIYYTWGGNLTSLHNPRLTLISNWIDFGD